MEHQHMHHHETPAPAVAGGSIGTKRLALRATIHCLTGCSIGEVLGMIIGPLVGFGMWETVALAVVLAFIFGYGLTLLPLVRAEIPLGQALKLALATDTLSIAIMEVVDNAVMMAIPGAMEAGPGDLLFWGSMIVSLGLAGVAAFPVNVWLIKRGRGGVHSQH